MKTYTMHCIECDVNGLIMREYAASHEVILADDPSLGDIVNQLMRHDLLGQCDELEIIQSREFEMHRSVISINSEPVYLLRVKE